MVSLLIKKVSQYTLDVPFQRYSEFLAAVATNSKGLNLVESTFNFIEEQKC